MSRRYQRYSSQFKLQLVDEYVAGQDTLQAIARAHGVHRSLLSIWVRKCERGDLYPGMQRTEERHAESARIAALERKIGQLTMELDALKKGARVQASRRNGRATHWRYGDGQAPHCRGYCGSF